MSLSAIHYSSATAEWSTPQDVFDKLNTEFGFTVDVCCTHENAKCERHYTKAEDGLLQDWSGEVAWMNPPYGAAIKTWMRKAYTESLMGGGNGRVPCPVQNRYGMVA